MQAVARYESRSVIARLWFQATSVLIARYVETAALRHHTSALEYNASICGLRMCFDKQQPTERDTIA